MPELPDLQVFSNNLTKQLAGKRLIKIIALGAKVKDKQKVFDKELVQKKIVKVYRQGKELFFEFEANTILSIHLMLNGKFFLFHGKNEQKHTLLELYFDNTTGLALTDFQGQALPTVNPAPKTAPDALTDLTLAYLKDKISKSKSAVKTFLMDQKIVRGIGNAYADEILWEAKLSPLSTCNKIPAEIVEDLFKSIRTVLINAEKEIRKNHPDIIAGEIRDFLNVHNAKKKQSPTGFEIKQTTINSRKTYYTEEQKHYS